jgi:DNA invertase Pin-like site-specific DNA recombinase
MSTEHQQYSIANQSDVILKYAEDHNMQIVRTYSDAGKSGLTLQRRAFRHVDRNEQFRDGRSISFRS